VPHPPVGAVALGDGDRYVAASDAHDDVILWDTRTLKQIRRFAAQSSQSARNPVAALAISQDGRLLAAGTKQGQIRVWNISSGSLLRGNTQSGINDLAFNPAGTMLASAHNDGIVRLWNIKSQQLRLHSLPHPLSGHTGAVFGVAFNPSGDTVASANTDGTIRVWKVADGSQLAALCCHAGTVDGIGYSPDGSMLVSAGADNTVRLWDPRSQQQIGQTLRASHAAVESAAFGDGGQVIVSSDRTGAVQLYSGFLWSSFAQLKRQVCALVGTGLTPGEWSHYALGTTRYEKSCS
jgi:WD40 repeat protein